MCLWCDFTTPILPPPQLHLQIIGYDALKLDMQILFYIFIKKIAASMNVNFKDEYLPVTPP
jgi:hypothetical protein